MARMVDTEREASAQDLFINGSAIYTMLCFIRFTNSLLFPLSRQVVALYVGIYIDAFIYVLYFAKIIKFGEIY